MTSKVREKKYVHPCPYLSVLVYLKKNGGVKGSLARIVGCDVMVLALEVLILEADFFLAIGTVNQTEHQTMIMKFLGIDS